MRFSDFIPISLVIMSLAECLWSLVKVLETAKKTNVLYGFDVKTENLTLNWTDLYYYSDVSWFNSWKYLCQDTRESRLQSVAWKLNGRVCTLFSYNPLFKIEKQEHIIANFGFTSPLQLQPDYDLILWTKSGKHGPKYFLSGAFASRNYSTINVTDCPVSGIAKMHAFWCDYSITIEHNNIFCSII